MRTVALLAMSAGMSANGAQIKPMTFHPSLILVLASFAFFPEPVLADSSIMTAAMALTAPAESTTAAEIIAMEKAALTRWIQGDPSGWIEIFDEDVVYFDPYQERRIDGVKALSAYYEGLRGRIKANSFELLNPKVQDGGTMAVLTFNYVSRSGETLNRWNATEVYVKTPAGWRVIQSHWSRTQRR
jgi:hypothetical protein